VATAMGGEELEVLEERRRCWLVRVRRREGEG
jgi:hypothetical protein